jgi:MFS family permease
VLCFFYFVFVTIAGLGLQTFIPTVLGSVFGVSLALATSTLTAYLLGGAAGIFAGGFLAARTTRHDRVAAGGMLLGAAVISLVAPEPFPRRCCCRPSSWSVSRWVATARRATSSFAPRRRKVRRDGVYGFVYSGLDLAASSAPSRSASCSITATRARCCSALPRAICSRSAPSFAYGRASSRRTALARQVA